jgi:hypothetical protein
MFHAKWRGIRGCNPAITFMTIRWGWQYGRTNSIPQNDSKCDRKVVKHLEVSLRMHGIVTFSVWSLCVAFPSEQTHQNWKLKYLQSKHLFGARGGAVGWGTALQTERSRVRFPMVSLKFFIDIILPAALWPWGWLSLWQKWVAGVFPRGKGGRCVGLTTLPTSSADCLEIWEPQPTETLNPGL